jgi:hypothetical protein
MTYWVDYDWDEAELKDLEESYVRYMDQLTEYVMGEIDDVEIESTDPFCGCDVCWTRETLAFLMPRILDLYQSGHIWNRKQHGVKESVDGLQLVSDSGSKERGGLQ